MMGKRIIFLNSGYRRCFVESVDKILSKVSTPSTEIWKSIYFYRKYLGRKDYRHG